LRAAIVGVSCLIAKPRPSGKRKSNIVEEEQPFLAEHAPWGKRVAERWHASLVIARQEFGISGHLPQITQLPFQIGL
jgi:hypothetical protein